MRLIDADNLIRLLEREKQLASEDYEDDYESGLITALEFVDESPTVIEANEQLTVNASPVDTIRVVRCKDCKLAIRTDFGDILCDFSRIPCGQNDFCSFGERNDDSN